MSLGVVVCQPGDGTEELIARFAEARRADGIKLGGVYQRTGIRDGCRVMELIDLQTGERLPLSQALGSASGSCILDPEGLAQGAMAIRRARAGRVDLIVVSKFGTQESKGKGMAEELFLAAAEGFPVLTSVTSKYLDAWTRLSGGVGTRLRPTMTEILRWWSSVSPKEQRHQATTRS